MIYRHHPHQLIFPPGPPDIARGGQGSLFESNCSAEQEERIPGDLASSVARIPETQSLFDEEV